MSTSSLEQAILKISKVMEDFVGEQQKINSHLNEKIDNLESSMNILGLSPRVGEATKVMLTSRTGHLLDLQYNGS
ncbi:hypothetical protein CK203_102215 [Vitis vinifera]|uniref:Uncharacterized protein n=1 Tax=Vitis vinifera TaxID=29760 RepID=A0A438DFE6_VITVI|nr:hypothetical protein CK203_102215 [Vitis vinifera]